MVKIRSLFFNDIYEKLDSAKGLKLSLEKHQLMNLADAIRLVYHNKGQKLSKAEFLDGVERTIFNKIEQFDNNQNNKNREQKFNI